MGRLWTGCAWLIAALVGLPVAVVAVSFASPPSPAWTHIRETVLADYVANTVFLMALVGVASALVGIATAWMVATRDFPGRRFLSWALVLPLAVPAYVVAYVYADLLEYAGPVQTMLRALGGWAGWEGSVLPPIRSLGGAALVLGLVLYPYVYLLARTAFESQAAALVDAARVLGAGPRRAFFGIALPAARPLVAGGVALAMMETAADFGVVEYFGVATFTTGIFRAWFALGERAAALQLAAWLFLVVAILVAAEHWARRGGYGNPVAGGGKTRLVELRGWRGWAASGAVALPFVLGFAVPVVVLVRHAIATGDPLLGRAFGDFVLASVGVSGTAAVLTAGFALVLAYSGRLSRARGTLLAIRTATLGYALPGAILALGVLAPLTAFDKALAGLLETHFDVRAGLLLTGTAAALVYAYSARFLTVAYNACQGGMEKIHRRLDEAARTLGATPGRVLREVHAPLLRGAAASAVLLVFIDAMKELPATLILRPFNFETLATRVYRLASDERLGEASTAALAIVAVGAVPALLLAVSTRRRAGRNAEGDVVGEQPAQVG